MGEYEKGPQNMDLDTENAEGLTETDAPENNTSHPDTGAADEEPAETKNLLSVTEEDALTDYPTDGQMQAEEEPDENLVSEAYNHIETIFVEKMNSIMEEVGKYLFDAFFDGDVNRAQKKKPLREKSFLRLAKTLRKNHAHAPSMSWLYNAVNVAADEMCFEETDLPVYNKLGTTHKVYLTRVKDFNIKRQIAEEVVDKELSTRDLEERINQTKNKRTRLDLENLDTPEAQEVLSTKRPVELKKLLQKTKSKKNDIKKKQEELRLELIRKEQRYGKSIDVIKRAIKQKPSQSKPGQGNS